MCVVCCRICSRVLYLFFFFNDTATTEIYTLSLHDALPICMGRVGPRRGSFGAVCDAHLPARRSLGGWQDGAQLPDRKSTRLNSSHSQISYAVFCLKKKKQSTVASMELT